MGLMGWTTTDNVYFEHWIQVLEHAGVKRLTRKVKLRAPPSESKFWRYHSAGDGHLSTVEG